MAEPAEVAVAAGGLAVRRKPRATIVVAGSPNSGKSTLFNRLTGLRQRTANYPGVTVERHVGTVTLGDDVLELIDLPGTFALSAFSLEERIAVDVILGRMDGVRAPSGVLAVLDATRLYQGLLLVQQLLEIGLPVVVALTMTDAARAAGLHVDVQALGERLGGVTVCPVVATTGAGLDELRAALHALPAAEPPAVTPVLPELRQAATAIAADHPDVPVVSIERAIVEGMHAVGDRAGREALAERVAEARVALFDSGEPVAEEARRRYGRVREVMDAVLRKTPPLARASARLSRWLQKPLPGTLGFFIVMAAVFQAVFAWATPIMDLIDGGAAALSGLVARSLPEGMLASFLADGVIAGIGSVVIFLPQILILFLFIIVLEDTGYLARAAYLMDRPMRWVGLSGQSIIAMISSFACAVPGIMATRVVANRRDRIATIMAAPFLTCSARLPVYSLLIAAFIPQRTIGFLNLQGLVLFGLYLLGIAGALVTAFLLRKTRLRGPKPAFAMSLPPFRRPNLRTVAIHLYSRAKIFLRRAGTVIFAVAVVVWALAFFPRSAEVERDATARVAAAEATLFGAQLADARAQIENDAAAAQLEQSALGRMGKAVEPVFRPLGWDWKIASAVIAGFPAREVVLAVLGTIYATGDEVDEGRLSERLRSATHPDGSPVFTLPMVLGLLVFYAFCLQCAATLAAIRRETNSWGWTGFSWFYMTSLGYLGALLVYQLGSLS